MRIIAIIVIIPLILTGCTIAKAEKDAILRDGIRTDVKVEKDAISQPLVKVEPKAVTVEQGAISQPLVKVDPITITQSQPLIKVEPKAVNVEPGAVQFKVEKDAVVIHPGAFQFNFNLGQKPPQIEIPDVKGIRKISDKDVINKVSDKKLAEDIINNETIYKAIIDTLLKRIEFYNQNYATDKK